MKIAGRPYRTIWPVRDGGVEVIDQTKLPHRFETVQLHDVEQAAHAIKAMLVRGAPLIGVTAAYGLAMALRRDASDMALANAITFLAAQRPTAVNLAWALEQVRRVVAPLPPAARAAAAWAHAGKMADDDVETCRAIGEHGLTLIHEIAAKKSSRASVNILTHCNAGWLACVDWGTATSPMYQAHDAGVPIHVWVDETRPRNQGASLTAFELGSHGVPHTLISDNSGGHLMQHGLVDLVIVGTDRVTANGDVANKIGTYLKALAAKDNGVPFWVALPFSTIDWTLDDGRKIEIEQRAPSELLEMTGRTSDGDMATVAIAPPGTRARNDAFDVTPARLVTGFITERGRAPATYDGLSRLYPDRAA
jgi:methylthioribose-1-phosphate isomerase